MLKFVQIPFMFIRTSLRWLEEGDAVSKELSDKDLLSITSKSSSSIRDLFRKLDWLPPSSTHRVSLFQPLHGRWIDSPRWKIAVLPTDPPLYWAAHTTSQNY
jgi:hypothetical protein